MTNNPNPVINPNQLLRIKQVVELLSVSESTVRRYVKSGLLPSPKKLSPRVVVWKYSDISNFIQKVMLK